MVAQEGYFPIALVKNCQLLIYGCAVLYFRLVLFELGLKGDGGVVGSEDLCTQVIHVGLQVIIQLAS